MSLVEIDGSFGEGGGQVLRTAVCFSIVFGKAIRVRNVRAGRPVPGLRPQHAATLRILRDICDAELAGGDIGSTDVTFRPGRLKSGLLRFDLGTAASIPLVLQAVIPSVSLAGGSLSISLVGGTDVPWSPTSDYISEVMRPAFRVIGLNFDYEVKRRGYYPKGSGRADVRVQPCAGVLPLELMGPRGDDTEVHLFSRCARLPPHVAERQANAASSVLSKAGVAHLNSHVSVEDSISPGSSLLVSMTKEGDCFLGADAIGARGKRAEVVGTEAANSFVGAFSSGATVDGHLADMIAPILCLARGESRFVLPEVTEHLRTSLHVAATFTAAAYTFAPSGRGTELRVSPPSRTK